MIVKIMSLLDVTTAVMMILYQYGDIKTRLMLSFATYLFIKAILFRGDFASFLDACIAVYMVLMIFISVPIITWIAAIYLIQKAVIGFIN